MQHYGIRDMGEEVADSFRAQCLTSLPTAPQQRAALLVLLRCWMQGVLVEVLDDLLDEATLIVLLSWASREDLDYDVVRLLCMSPDSLPALLEWLAGQNAGHADALMPILRSWPSTRGRAVLQRLSREHCKPEIRLLALEGLHSSEWRPTAAERDLLHALVADQDIRVRLAALQVLGEKEDDAIARIADIAWSSEDEAGLLAIRALGGPAESNVNAVASLEAFWRQNPLKTQHDLALAESALEELLDSSHEEAGRSVVRALKEGGPAIQSIVRALCSRWLNADSDTDCIKKILGSPEK
jgi:hypothetical protein